MYDLVANKSMHQMDFTQRRLLSVCIALPRLGVSLLALMLYSRNHEEGS